MLSVAGQRDGSVKTRPEHPQEERTCACAHSQERSVDRCLCYGNISDSGFVDVWVWMKTCKSTIGDKVMRNTRIRLDKQKNISNLN